MGMLEQVSWWLDVLPDVNQLGLGKRCWNLAASSANVEFRLRTFNEFNQRICSNGLNILFVTMG